MTPAARIAASIEILDMVLAGVAAEKVLTRWGRANRYAGSGDRAAIRDQVFDVLRCKNSFGFLGGGVDGRALMIGWIFALGKDHKDLFSAEKYAPGILNGHEREARDLSAAPRATRLDCPDWLLDHYDASVGADADDILASFRQRAPVFLRVNTTKTSLNAVQDFLATSDIATKPHPMCATALEVVQNPRRVAQTAAYKDGLVELQDVASQAVVEFLPLRDGQTVLDYCAGGGGKSLAMAARAEILLTAHDIEPQRMKDLPVRAKRAGAAVSMATTQDLGGCRFDLVLCDVPCSGSGSWRRSPQAKWTLTHERLHQLVETQQQILRETRNFVADTGVLAYVTCSMLVEENTSQIGRFLADNRDWSLERQKQFSPLDGGDGFYIALLQRDTLK